MKSVLVGVLLCTAILWARSGHKPPELLAITNVSVVDTRYGEVEPNLTVVVKDGVIIAIAKVAILDSGPHVRVINGAGKFLIPGLWDSLTKTLRRRNGCGRRLQRMKKSRPIRNPR